jgi:penicillin-binding protein 2
MQDLYKNRYSVFIIAIIIVFSIFIVKIGSLQLGNNSYEEKAVNNALNKITLYPARSVIFDRNGKIIVKNYAIYDLYIFPKDFDQINTQFMCSVLEIDTTKFNTLFIDAILRSKKRQKNKGWKI